MNLPTTLLSMRKSALRAVALALLVLVMPPAGAETVPEPTGKRLRVLVAENFPDGNVFIGAAAHGKSVVNNPLVATILDREFSYITPANDLKQSTVHPEPDVWNWDLAFMWLRHARDQNQLLRVHGPISPQISTWAKEDNRTRPELLENMTSFLKAGCDIYSGNERVRWLDVINETILEDGSWHMPKEGSERYENPWGAIGLDNDAQKTPLYISKAFEIATKYCGGIKLLINQNHLTPAAAEKMKYLVGYIRGKGFRVDGIAWQGHITTGWEKDENNMRLLDDLITWAHKNNLEFHISEFQSNLHTRVEMFSKRKKLPLKVTEAELRSRYPAQAKTFAAVLELLLRHRNGGVVAINYWHVLNSEAMNKDGNLFEDNGVPRPAYYAVQNLLEHPPAPIRSKPAGR